MDIGGFPVTQALVEVMKSWGKLILKLWSELQLLFELQRAVFYTPNPSSSQGRDLLLKEGCDSSEVERDSCPRISPFPTSLS